MHLSRTYLGVDAVISSLNLLWDRFWPVRGVRAFAVVVAAAVLLGCSRDAGPGEAAERLNAAVAAAEGLPDGWVDTGVPISNIAVPFAGDGHGYCGGGNAAARAVSAGPFVIANQHGYRTGDGAAAWVTVFDFDRVVSAVAFMHATVADASDCAHSDYELREWVDGAEHDPDDGPPFVDLLPDNQSLDGTWHVDETTTPGPAASARTGDVFDVERARVFTGTADGTPAGESWRIVERWERRGTVVIALGHAATHDVSGRTISDNTVDPDELPTLADLEYVADHFRDPILRYLTDYPRPDPPSETGIDAGSL
jgi:hypothetical protein